MFLYLLCLTSRGSAVRIRQRPQLKSCKFICETFLIYTKPKIMFYTYILYSEKTNSYYIGSTSNIEDRVLRHNSGRSTYTKRGIPWKLVYSKTYNSKSEAYKAEMYIKSQKSRIFIEKLIGASGV